MLHIPIEHDDDVNRAYPPQISCIVILRWPEPIYLRVGYVFESGFSAGMTEPISMIFGMLSKEWSKFKKMLFIFL